MKKENSIVDAMMTDAFEEVVEKGWRNVPQNTITMACHKLIRDELREQRCMISGWVRPIWWLGTVLGAGIIWQIISSTVLG